MYRAAEEYYYQALEIFEANPDVFLPQALKVLWAHLNISECVYMCMYYITLIQVIEALVGVLKKLKRYMAWRN